MVSLGALSTMELYISSLTTTTPMGIIPLVVALAKVIKSGVTSNSSDANIEPVLAQPVTTSSKIKIILY